MVASRKETEFVDYSSLMELVPRQDNLADMLGLYEKDYHQGTLIELERVTDKTDKMYMVARDADRQFSGKETSQIEFFRIPFSTLDHPLKPSELQDILAYGEENAPKTVQKSVDRIVARLQRGHTALHKSVMFSPITLGKVYAKDEAGNDTSDAVVLATKWGVTAPADVALDFTAAGTDPLIVIEKGIRQPIIAAMGDNGSSVQLIAIVGSGYFNGLTSHPLIKERYLNRDKDSSFLTERLGGDSIRRTFSIGGVTFIEETDTSVVPRDKAFYLPLGVADMFKLDYAPANTIADANTVGQEAYLWIAEERRKIIVESEVSVLGTCTRPELIYPSTGTLQVWQ